MGILQFEDAENQLEVVCFPRQWPSVKPLLVQGALYILTGTPRDEGGVVSLLLEEARRIVIEALIRPIIDGMDPSVRDEIITELRQKLDSKEL